jgi:hypothetical protein
MHIIDLQPKIWYVVIYCSLGNNLSSGTLLEVTISKLQAHWRKNIYLQLPYCFMNIWVMSRAKIWTPHKKCEIKI